MAILWSLFYEFDYYLMTFSGTGQNTNKKIKSNNLCGAHTFTHQIGRFTS